MGFFPLVSRLFGGRVAVAGKVLVGVILDPLRSCGGGNYLFLSQ